ncbi:MAG: signal peptidase I [Pelagibacterales bacterium]|nr:signal peptidase I [Pelagibacterales bacterium]OUU61226.1 MAG: signal peptidase I [Alphaproteobacteria bacterium TMED62]
MIEVFRTFIFAIFIAIFLRSFAFEPFTIPSGSMKPNLLVGDFLFVSKFSYGFSKYSVPYGRYLPFNGRLFFSKPNRGDIAVFKYPGDNKTDYIKRIIGMPGDTIRISEGVVLINDKPFKKEKVGTFEDFHRNGYLEKFDLYREKNDIGAEYLVIDDISFDGILGSSFNQGESFDLNNTNDYTVPKDHYFVMGDNREHSSDSRILSQVGFVNEQNLVGKAAMIFLSIKYSNKNFQLFGLSLGKYPDKIRLNRIGKLL